MRKPKFTRAATMKTITETQQKITPKRNRTRIEDPEETIGYEPEKYAKKLEDKDLTHDRLIEDIKKDPTKYSGLSNDLKMDSNIVYAYIGAWDPVYFGGSTSSEEFKIDSNYISKIPTELFEKMEVCKKILEKNGDAYRLVNDEVKKMKIFTKLAFKMSDDILLPERIDPTLDNADFYYQIINLDDYWFYLLKEKYREDKAIARVAYKKDPLNIRYMGNLLDNNEFMIQLLHGEDFTFQTQKLKSIISEKKKNNQLTKDLKKIEHLLTKIDKIRFK